MGSRWDPPAGEAGRGRSGCVGMGSLGLRYSAIPVFRYSPTPATGPVYRLLVLRSEALLRRAAQDTGYHSLYERRYGPKAPKMGNQYGQFLRKSENVTV